MRVALRNLYGGVVITAHGHLKYNIVAIKIYGLKNGLGLALNHGIMEIRSKQI